MKKFIFLFLYFLITTSVYCDDSLLNVGQRYVTTKVVDIENMRTWSVFAPNDEALKMFLVLVVAYNHEVSELKTTNIMDHYGIISPVKSGVLVLVTEVDENVVIMGSKHTVYTVLPEGTSTYYRTFGKGLKPF